MIKIRQLGCQPYETIWQKMRTFTDNRTQNTTDELWILEHPPVFTQGQAGKSSHIINPGNIPVIQTDRGGQVTYHGPGQLVAYIMVDLKKRSLGIRTLVNQLEQILISSIGHFNIKGSVKFAAPGVYVQEKKIASIGLRVRKFCTYHGLALNVSMNTEPFTYINPCGYQGLKITQIKDFIPDITMQQVQSQFIEDFLQLFESSTINNK